MRIATVQIASKVMINTIMDIACIIFGLSLLIFHKWLGLRTSNFWYKIVPIRISEKGYEIGFLIVGILFIILGLISLLGFIHYKK